MAIAKDVRWGAGGFRRQSVKNLRQIRFPTPFKLVTSLT